MTNLYERFDCKDKYELLDRINNDDPVVQDLREFIDYAKCNIESPFKGITSPESFTEYYSSSLKDKTLNDDEFRCVFVNTKNIPVHHSIVALDTDESNISKVLQTRLKTPLKEGLSAGGGDVFLVRSELMNERKREKVLQFFEDVHLNVIDEMVLNDLGDSLYSSKGGYRESIKDVLSSNEKLLKHEQFYRYDGYSEFSSFYAEEEILGLNPIEDRYEVMENLKFGYQHEAQEYLGVIVYDDLNSVVSVDELFIGGINSAVVDHRIILKHVLAYEEAKGIIIFHNHPSGDPLTIV